jgi:hypothetical protein
MMAFCHMLINLVELSASNVSFQLIWRKKAEKTTSSGGMQEALAVGNDCCSRRPDTSRVTCLAGQPQLPPTRTAQTPPNQYHIIQPYSYHLHHRHRIHNPPPRGRRKQGNMSDGSILKADKDFTKEVDAALPEARRLASQGRTQAAIDKLLALEKQTRQASDLPSTNRILVAIVTIAKDAGDWNLLNEQVQLLSKKHGQLKQAVTKMVQVVMGFLDEAPTPEAKLSTIETLRTVTEGKV